MELTYFKSMGSYVEVVDLRAVCGVVGCIKAGTIDPQWAVIDRSDSWARTDFTDDSLTVEASQVTDS